MAATRAIVGIVAGALAAAGVIAVPALGKTEQRRVNRSAPTGSAARFTGAFTPAAADPRLAAAFARGGLNAGDFRFTPAADARQNKRSVTVAVRARSTASALAANEASNSAASVPTIGIAPIAYNLGVAVGWKKFAVTGNLARVDYGLAPGSREAADVAVSYRVGRGSSRLVAATDRPLAGTNKLVEDAPSYSIDLSSSYSLTRNLDLTAGMRYRSDRERLAQLGDDRHDSQAAYLGTAFRF